MARPGQSRFDSLPPLNGVVNLEFAGSPGYEYGVRHYTNLFNRTAKTILATPPAGHFQTPTMKTIRSLFLIACIAGILNHASANTYDFSFTSGFANSAVIPDGDTNGWSDTRVLSGMDNLLISDVNVVLHLGGGYGVTSVSVPTNSLSDGFNGDFYAYLTHGSGFSVLLNRVGRTSGNSSGYGDTGMNITFDDSAANGDVHAYQSVPGFSTTITDRSAWSPDGRNVNPLLALDTDSRTSLLNQFNGLSPNGNWTLFIADVSTGEQTVINEWGLSITAVPEPTSLSLGVLGGLIWLRAHRKLRVRL